MWQPLLTVQADDLKFMNDKRMTDLHQVADCHDDEGSVGSSSSGQYALIGNARFLSGAYPVTTSSRFDGAVASALRRHRIVLSNPSAGHRCCKTKTPPRRGFALRQTGAWLAKACQMRPGR